MASLHIKDMPKEEQSQLKIPLSRIMKISTGQTMAWTSRVHALILEVPIYSKVKLNTKYCCLTQSFSS
jgi:hypothetical protein